MAEIRLICPGCAAEYRVPETAVPPDGREVECSACGNVWFARPAPPETAMGGTAPTPPAALPPLNRRLPDSVLDILRDEVEHERRARASEAPGPTAKDSPQKPRLVVDPEWPATTITRHYDPDPADGTAPEPAAPAATPVPLPVATQPAPPAAAVAPPKARSADRPPVPSAMPVPTASASARPGYRTGFAVALAAAATVAGLYLAAPRMAEQGLFGSSVTAFRAQADQARSWLQDRAATLIR